MSQILRDARRYEEINEKKIKTEERPRFHLSARVGWMNDPNGFSYYNGSYHMFYQYHPYNSHWGPMHWGHAVSTDLLHWTYLPAALAPDQAYDAAGCFSGSALALPDGRQLLMYTGVHREDDCGIMRDVQTQCLAVGDGTDYEKYGANPVLDETDLPEGNSKFDFRDPKMWQRADGSFRCVVGNCVGERDGQVLLFGSPDGFHWSFLKVLAANNGRFGKAWECPDFFALDGKQVLLVSPMDMLQKGLEYHNGNGTLCLIGGYDEQEEVFTEEKDQAIDYGIDFYAPQTVLTPDGRRVMIGWLQNGDTCNLHSPEKPWFGQMSLPRELSIRDGRLIQRPLRELEALRGEQVAYEGVTFSGVKELAGIGGRHVDLELVVRPVDESNLFQKFSVWFAQDEICHTSVSFRPWESIVKIDRKFSGTRRAVIHQRRSRVRNRNGEIKLRIILDTYSVEVFVNDGEQVLSATMYTDPSAEGISFLSDGIVTMDVVKYDIV